VTGQLILELAPPAPPTFDNFVAGANGVAVAAVRAAVLGDGERIVYLWGDAGSGRSHLLAAAARAAKIVACDDVHRLDAAGQIEAFDAFNRAHAAGIAFVAAGDAPPAQLAVREDLRTRLGSGLVFQLHALSDDAKRGALRARATGRGMALPDEVAEYLLRRLPRDLGTQFAVLDALDRYSLAQKRALTLPLVREAIDALGLRNA
jgi:DnaA family protein